MHHRLILLKSVVWRKVIKQPCFIYFFYTLEHNLWFINHMHEDILFSRSYYIIILCFFLIIKEVIDYVLKRKSHWLKGSLGTKFKVKETKTYWGKVKKWNNFLSKKKKKERTFVSVFHSWIINPSSMTFLFSFLF